MKQVVEDGNLKYESDSEGSISAGDYEVDNNLYKLELSIKGGT